MVNQRYRPNSVRRGMTLIELLLVLVIIALLAALAAVNLQRAQIRAKAVRARSDLRTFAAAFEAYMTDWGTLPFKYHKLDPDYHPPYTGFFYRSDNSTNPLWRLTSPIAYLSSVSDQLVDPFATGARRGNIPAPYRSARLDTGRFYLAYTGGPSTGPPYSDPRVYTFADTYFIFSRGPGYLQDGTFLYFERVWPISGITHYWSTDAGGRRIVGYDPTNGLTSPGLIYRLGGRRPFWFRLYSYPTSN